MKKNQQTLKERFDKKYVKVESGCWEWIASSRGNGYGCMKIDNKVHDSHRISYMLYKGEIPKGLLVCHTCDNRKCVNPDHLFVGTYSDNMIDCSKKGRISMQNEKTRIKVSKTHTVLYGIKIEDKKGNVFQSIKEAASYYGWKSLNYIRQQLEGKRNNKYGFKLIGGGIGRHNPE